VQAVGRAIRRAEDKAMGTVIVPVVVPPGSSDEEILNSGSFAQVWRVVRALRAHDDVLGIELDALRYELGRRPTTTPTLPRKLQFVLPKSASSGFMAALSVRLVEATTPSWEAMFGRLTAFADEHESVKMSTLDHDFDRSLYQWMSQQRKDFARRALPSERAQRLQALPGWVWDADLEALERGFAELQAFVASNGTSLVPQHHTTKNVFPLGWWCHKVRSRHAKGRLPAHFAERLNAIPSWSWTIADRGVQPKLRAYRCWFQRERHGRVPPSHVEQGVPLGSFMRQSERRARRGMMSPSLRAELDAINPNWMTDLGVRNQSRPPQEAVWMKKLHALRREVERLGTADLPQKHVSEEGIALGLFVAAQRSLFQAGALSEPRIRALEALPGWMWSKRAAHWQQMFNTAQAYLAKYGAAWHQRCGEDGRAVRNWVTTQQQRLKEQRLPEEQERLLDEHLPGWRPRRASASSDRGR
jgi:hypothetical protein